jgi:hypothetical protein
MQVVRSAALRISWLYSPDNIAATHAAERYRIFVFTLRYDFKYFEVK